MIIYETTNLLDGRKYLGKDIHNNPKYYGSSEDLKNDIKILGKENFKKEILEYCNDRKHLVEREEYYLELVDAKNNPLYYNKTNCSGGGSSKSLEARRSISEKLKGRSPYKNKSPEEMEEIKKKMRSTKSLNKVGEKLSKKFLGRKLSEETKQKMRKPKDKNYIHPMKGKHISRETSIKISKSLIGRRNTWSDGEIKKKPILQYDLNGIFIKEWVSTKEASEKLKIDRAGISNVLNNKNHTAGGFKFKFK